MLKVPPSRAARSRTLTSPSPRSTIGRSILRIESDAVVLDFDEQPIGQVGQAHVALRRLGVLGHVGDRLLHDAVGRHLDVARQPIGHAIWCNSAWMSCRRASPRSDASMAAGNPRSSSAAGCSSCVRLRTVCSAPSVIGLRLDQRPADPPPASIDRCATRQLHFDRRQHLADFVMQLARNGPALFFLRVISFAAVFCSSLRDARVALHLRAQLRFEPPGVPTGHQQHAEPDDQRDAEPRRLCSSATRWISAMSRCCWMNARRLIAWISSEIASAASRRGTMRRFRMSRTAAGFVPAASASTAHRGRVELLDLVAQLADLFAFGRRARHRLVVGERHVTMIVQDASICLRYSARRRGRG